MTFELDRYLSRINLSRPNPTVEGLAKMQEAQLNAIAFENVDAFLSSIPDLAPAALIEKILNKGRGGYCFELNGLLGLALQALGFDFEPILARVWMGRSEGGPRSHLAFLVKVDGELWLVDAGFGGPGPKMPLLISLNQSQQQNHETYRIKLDPVYGEMLVETYQNGDWFALYSFDRMKVRRCDLEAANVVCSVWNQSPLSKSLILCRNTEYGRIHLFNKIYTETCGSGQISRLIETFDDLQYLIRNQFGIAVTATELNRIIWRLRFESREVVPFPVSV